ncbi:divergent polysaccharide deacetylase family protein [Paenibacillus tuaregi]|uniref:divergent polysaccharide deacetylase family protein n=1 Tax=Paenibacillus tuaregi TaxID=1816681 RepID=UPI00083937CD|nr:divergent polysaccharide deacetylase family protein [Paenibacillus tuaregi]
MDRRMFRTIGKKTARVLTATLLCGLVAASFQPEVKVQAAGLRSMQITLDGAGKSGNPANPGNPGSVKSPEVHQPKKKLAVIIDDLGNNMAGTDEILSMPVKLTVAVMPFLPSTEKDAKRAHERGYDVLLHLPMEPKHGRPEWLGPGAILTSMSDAEVRKRVEEAIDNVPFVVGINNHMGSKATADERIMSIVLDVCKERGLFFVDSKTNYRSVVGKLCAQRGLPQVNNHIFLDDVASIQHISKQIMKVAEWLKEHDHCVTIGHVGGKGKKTAAVLKQSIDTLKQEADFVGVSELAREQHQISPGPIFP